MVVTLFALLLCIVAVQSAKQSFSPHVDNGGTVVGLAGKDYVLFAADTRLKNEYAIHTRNITRLFEIADGLLFTGAYCWTDVLALSKELKNEATVYEWEHRMKLALRPFSYLVASKLYKRRMFPYYTFPIVAGIDSEGVYIHNGLAFLFVQYRTHISLMWHSSSSGTGAVYRYDAAGSTERVIAACSGSGEKLIQPILDELTNMEEDNRLWELAPNGENTFISSSGITPLPCSTSGNVILEELSALSRKGGCVGLESKEACEVILRAFRAAAEREITVGDGLDIWVLKANKNNIDKFGISFADTNAYLLEKYHYPLPTH